jgi:YVTN family beta-propeller protein
MEPSAGLGLRIRRAALRAAVVVSLLAGVGMAFAPASSAAGSTYAVTEVPASNYGLLGVAADPVTDTVYATDNQNVVTVIDGADNTVTTQIDLRSRLDFVAVDQASDTVYAISSSFSDTAEVINGATNTVTATISLPGTDPRAGAVNPVTHMVYVADAGLDAVIVINGTTDTVAATIPLDNALPADVAVDSVTNTVYVSGRRGDQITVIDGATNTVTGQIALPAGSDPVGVAVDPDAGRVYVADNATNAISVIDAATDTVSTVFSGITNPFGLALDVGTGTLYAAAYEGNLDGLDLGTTYVIDTASGAVTAQIPRGGASVAVSVSGGPAYIAQSSGVELDNDVTVISPSTVNTMSPVIVGSTSFTFVVGQASQDQLTASAAPAATFTAADLPSWLSLSPSGLLSGTPPVGSAVEYDIPVTASNGIQPDASTTIELEVLELPVIASADSTTFQVGVPGSFTLLAYGNPRPTLSESGTLPAGVTFTAEDDTFSGTPPAGSAGIYPIQITATNSVGSVTQAFTLIVPKNLYTPVGPVRVLDTRNGTGGYSRSVGPGKTISLKVDGVDGVPASGVTAVVLNVTAVGPTASGYVTVYPDRLGPPPVASNLNFARGQTIANLVVVAVGPSGYVNFYNAAGNVNLVADLAGYYSNDTGSSFTAAGPVRVLDTRNGTGGRSGPVGAGKTISLQVAGVDGVPTSGVSAVVLNVTAVGPTASDYVTVYPGGQARPLASNLNFAAGQTIPNLVVVPVGPDGTIDFYNDAGNVNLVADLAGYFSTSATGSSFLTGGPVRVLDTRNGTGGHSGPVGAGTTISLQMTGTHGIPATGVSAVVLNVTAVGPTASSYVTIYPGGQARPLASNLNFATGQTIPNLVVVPVGRDGTIDFYNDAGNVNLVADLAGYYVN